jgi:hypothetical protein
MESSMKLIHSTLSQTYSTWYRQERVNQFCKILFHQLSNKPVNISCTRSQKELFCVLEKAKLSTSPGWDAKLYNNLSIPSDDDRHLFFSSPSHNNFCLSQQHSETLTYPWDNREDRKKCFIHSNFYCFDLQFILLDEIKYTFSIILKFVQNYDIKLLVVRIMREL